MGRSLKRDTAVKAKPAGPTSKKRKIGLIEPRPDAEVGHQARVLMLYQEALSAVSLRTKRAKGPADTTGLVTSVDSRMIPALPIQTGANKALQKRTLTPSQNKRLFFRHDYHDLILEKEGNIDSKLFVNPKGKGMFPIHLHTMLNDTQLEGLTDTISWQPHGRAFKVYDRPKFVEHILPKYFSMSSLHSFHRQLSLYGFLRITQGIDKGAYYHERFLRGKPFLCMSMKRIRVKGNKIRPTYSPDSEPDFSTMPPAPLSSGPSCTQIFMEGLSRYNARLDCKEQEGDKTNGLSSDSKSIRKATRSPHFVNSSGMSTCSKTRRLRGTPQQRPRELSEKKSRSQRKRKVGLLSNSKSAPNDVGASRAIMRSEPEHDLIMQVHMSPARDVKEPSSSGVSPTRKTKAGCRKNGSTGSTVKLTKQPREHTHSYHDHAFDDENEENSTELMCPTFPFKLYDMLNSVYADGFDHVVHWLPHGRAFVVRSPDLFELDLLPRYFPRMKQWRSFRKQLNIYGFTRLTHVTDKAAYYHELFLAGKRYLCHGIKPSRTFNPIPGSNEPDFTSMPAIPTTEDSAELKWRPEVTRTNDTDARIYDCNAENRKNENWTDNFPLVRKLTLPQQERQQQHDDEIEEDQRRHVDKETAPASTSFFLSKSIVESAHFFEGECASGIPTIVTPTYDRISRNTSVVSTSSSSLERLSASNTQGFPTVVRSYHSPKKEKAGAPIVHYLEEEDGFCL